MKEINNRNQSDRDLKSYFGFMNRSRMFTAMLVIYDIITANVSYFGALWLRFDLRFSMIPQAYLDPFLKFAPFYTVVCLIVFRQMKLYSSIWRFASYTELTRIIIASCITALFHTSVITLVLARMPISYYLFGALLQFFFMTAIRFSYRFVLLEREIRNSRNSDQEKENIMLILHIKY